MCCGTRLIANLQNHEKASSCGVYLRMAEAWLGLEIRDRLILSSRSLALKMTIRSCDQAGQGYPQPYQIGLTKLLLDAV